MRAKKTKNEAFTFVEVMVALTVISIALVALLTLNMTSIRLADTTHETIQAVLLANDKIAEALASDNHNYNKNYGIVNKDNLKLHWQRKFSNVQLPQLEHINASELTKVSVDVSWKKTKHTKHLIMSTYVTDRKLK